MTTSVRPESARTRLHEAPSLRPTPPRMQLQRRAPRTIRRHFRRAIARVLVLVAADLTAFVVLRSVVRAVRDAAVLGSAPADWVGVVLPRGYLGGWQFAAALLGGLVFAGTYGRGDRRRDVKRLFAAVLLAVSLSLWQSVWEVGLGTVAVQFAVTLSAFSAALVVERLGVDWVVERILPSRHRAERVIFVGDPDDRGAARVFSRLVKSRRVDPVGWVATNGVVGGGRYLGSVEQFWEVLQGTEADTVILCGELAAPVFASVVEAATAAGCHILSVSRHDAVAHVRPALVWHRGIPFVELTVPALKGQQLLIKRIVDLIGATMGVILLWPLFLVVAVAIKLDSPGPVFFSQERIGYGGKVFRLLKFRTMRNGADGEKARLAHLNHSGDPRLFKIPNDPRVTRLGAWLRRWSLDELPQLCNVLVGDMSLIGPRPFFESDLAEYLDHHFVRLGAKPGITGLWQISGRSAVVDFEEVVRLDREYIDRWSLWVDLKILLLTLPAVMRRNGAF